MNERERMEKKKAGKKVEIWREKALAERQRDKNV